MTTSRFIGRNGDFDFLLGHWHVHNRRLQRRHAGCITWDEFPATLQAWVMLDGGVSVDETRFPTQGFAGMTLRTLDQATKRWSIYWINSNSGQLFPPVQGGFDGERGEFYGDDHDDGRAVQVRFIWTRQGPDAARWEQAFALEGGAWEDNWVMEMRRAQESPAARSASSHSRLGT
ncbi:MAG: hypothetical protein ABI433_09565 [Burkholderiaceae bacterium]